MKKISLCLLAALLLFALTACEASSETTTSFQPTSAAEDNTSAKEADESVTTTSATEAPTEETTEAPTEAPTEETTEAEMTMGQKNALASAKNYLSLMAFSYTGLIEQLEFEEYSHEDAVFAADNCGADWNEQAAKSAKNYLELMSFSRSGLIEQLEFEGFTTEQAEYGVTANGY